MSSQGHTVIVNEKLRNSELIRMLDPSPRRFTGSILPDLIFNDCIPSLSITIGYSLDDQSREKMEKVQKHSHNCHGVVIGTFTHEEWMMFQNSVEIGTMRLFLVRSVEEAVELIKTTREIMNCPDKYTNQAKYFTSLASYCSSNECARTIARDLLTIMNIPDEEIMIIMEALPTLYALLTTPKQVLDEMLPVNQDTLEKLAILFDTESQH
eukprot:gene5777-6363_t